MPDHTTHAWLSIFTLGVWLDASAFPVEGMDDISDQYILFLRCKVGLVVREAKITDRDRRNADPSLSKIRIRRHEMLELLV